MEKVHLESIQFDFMIRRVPHFLSPQRHQDGLAACKDVPRFHTAQELNTPAWQATAEVQRSKVRGPAQMIRICAYGLISFAQHTRPLSHHEPPSITQQTTRPCYINITDPAPPPLVPRLPHHPPTNTSPVFLAVRP